MTKILLCLLLLFQLNCVGQHLSFDIIKYNSYTNQNGDFFYLLNDSILVSNLNGYGDTTFYEILSDTIFSYQQYSYNQAGKNGVENIIHYFVFNQVKSDTIKMVAYGFYDRNYHKENVNYIFVNNKLLERKIDNFEYIIIERLSPFWGYTKLKFRSDRVVEFFIDMKNVSVNYMQIDTAKTQKPAKKTISVSEFDELKSTITKAKIITWPVGRFNCTGTDRCDVNITLKADSKFYYSLGCTIPYQLEGLMKIYNSVLDKFIIYDKEK